MHWSIILLMVIVAVFMFALGVVLTMLHCDKKMKNMTFGELFVTRNNFEPFLVPKVPMETIAEQIYITLEVKLVDDSQK